MSEEKKLRDKILNLSKIYFDKFLAKQNLLENKIPVTQKKICHKDISNIIEAGLDGWFTSGRFTNQFESKIAKFLDLKRNALFVNSGSSANLVALTALCQVNMMNELNLKPIDKNSEVITVAAGFPTTVLPILQNNLIPVFVDVDINNLNITIENIKKAFTKKTRAVMVAHTLGNPFRADLISDFCKENNLYLIEDTCDALGSEIILKNKKKFCGTFGHFGSLSFYPAHHITTGEGGAVLTSSPKLRRIAASVRDWGRHCWCDSGKDNTCKKRFDWKFENLPHGYDHKYVYSTAGYNLKGTDLQASLGVSQIEKLNNFIEIRRDNWNFYNKIFKENKTLQENFQTIIPTENTNPSWFGFGLICKKNFRNSLLKHLDFHGIGTRLLFAGNITKQPLFKGLKFKLKQNLKNSDYLSENFFWIGLHPNITKNHILRITEVIELFFKKN